MPASNPPVLFGQQVQGTGYNGDTHSEMHGRTLEAWENVKAHGAIGDGVTDDAAAIQSAVTALAATGGTVYFPAGTYKVLTTITDGGKPVTFRGAGGETSVIKGSGITILSITYGGAGNRLSGTSVVRLGISDSVGHASTIGIDIQNADAAAIFAGSNAVPNWSVEDCLIIGQPGNLGTGVRCVFALKGIIKGGNIEEWNVGVSLQREGAGSNQSNANHLSGVKIRSNNTGLSIPAGGADNVSLSGCTIEGNNIGINAACGKIQLSASHLENNSGVGNSNITLSGTSSLSSYGNGFYNATALRDIVIPSGNGHHYSFNDLLNAGVSHSGTGHVQIVNPDVGVPGVTGTGPISEYSALAGIRQLQPLGNNGFSVSGWALFDIANTVKVGAAGSVVGFFGQSGIGRPSAYTNTYATSDKTLSAYTPDTESVAYTGAVDTEAKLADLNALRVAYENLRVFAEDLAQQHNSLIADLKSLGLLQ